MTTKQPALKRAKRGHLMIIPKTPKRNTMPSFAWHILQIFAFILCLYPLSASAQDVVLDLWHSYQSREETALKTVVKDFEQSHPGVRVSVLQVPEESFNNKAFTAIPRGSGPDVFIRAHDIIGNWAENKIIADLSNDLTPDEKRSFHPTTIEALSYKNALYAVPLAYKSTVLFYNRDLIPDNAVPDSSDDLLKYIETHTNFEQQKYALIYDNTSFFYHGAWFNGFSGSLFDDDGNVRLATKENAKSFEFARLLSKYQPAGMDGARIKTLFNDGNAAMVINGPWFMAELREGLNYGVHILPIINETGKRAAPFVTAEGIFMANDEAARIKIEAQNSDLNDEQRAAFAQKKRQTALALMKYIAENGAYTRIIEGRQMVAYTAAYDALKKDTRPEAAFMQAVAPTFLKQLDNTVPQSNRPEMGSLWSTLQNALTKSLYGGPSGETPYLLFLFLTLVVSGFIFLAKATNPSTVTRQKHITHITLCVLSFVLAIPIFYWMMSIQGSNSLVDPMAALTEAQSRASTLKAPPAEAANPWPYITILCGIAAVGCLLGIKAFKKHQAKNIEYTDNKIAIPFVAPAIIGMIVLVFLPFIVGAALSFFCYQNGEFVFVGLQNFARLFSAGSASFLDSMSFYFTFVVTVLWTITNVALHVGIGMALALMLREPWLKLKGLYRVLLIVPWAIPNYITALIWRGMFNAEFGAINNLLTSLGLEKINWYSEFLTSFAANLTTNTWLGFPFMMVVTLGALQAIPRDLEDAAAVDGASAWQRFRHVTFPLLKPALMPSVILGSIWTFNAFNIIYLVSKGDPDGSTEILVTEAYKWAFERQYQYGYAAAYAMVVFAILVLYSKLTQLVLEDNKA